MILRLLLSTCILILANGVNAQHNKDVSHLQPTEEYENIHVQKIHTDGVSSTFVIWVKQGVKSHKHEKHTEQLYILDGTAQMTVNDETFEINAGEWVLIPMGAWHSVVVNSEFPLKVLSFQAPEFLGKDRIWQEQTEKKY